MGQIVIRGRLKGRLMNYGFFGTRASGAVLAVVIAGIGCRSALAQPAPVAASEPAETDATIAPQTLPPNIAPDSPLAQVVKLAQSGVD